MHPTVEADKETSKPTRHSTAEVQQCMILLGTCLEPPLLAATMLADCLFAPHTNSALVPCPPFNLPSTVHHAANPPLPISPE
eukprot:768463-Hanusia_phi.AAC.9